MKQVDHLAALEVAVPVQGQKIDTSGRAMVFELLLCFRQWAVDNGCAGNQERPAPRGTSALVFADQGQVPSDKLSYGTKVVIKLIGPFHNGKVDAANLGRVSLARECYGNSHIVWVVRLGYNKAKIADL